jgi:hypothetical protein
MKWLGIHGASRSGKDTAADYILKLYGGEKVALADPMKHFCRDVFGFTEAQLWGPSQNRNAPDSRYMAPLRAATMAVVRVRFQEQAPAWILSVLPHFTTTQRAAAGQALGVWFEDCLAQEGLTPRYTLQTLGTEWGRAQDPNIWLKYADKDATMREIAGYCLIPDCRFLNEGLFLHEKNALLIEVLRPGFDGEDAMAAGVAAHPSEMERIRHKDEFRKYITHTINNDDTLETFYKRIQAVIEEGPRRVKENGVSRT